MVTRVDSSLPVVINPTKSYAKPIIALLAVAALGYLVIQVVKCLIGRVQPKSTAAQLYALGCEALRDGKNAVAISEFTLALQRMPDQQLRAKIFAARSDAYRENKRYQEALADFDSAIACHPRTDLLFFICANRGQLLALNNDHDRAIANYNVALALPFSDNDLLANILNGRGVSRYTLTQYAESLADYNAALALNPQDQHFRALLLTQRAAANDKLNQPETVLQDLTDALACDFDDSQLRRYLFRTRGDFYTQSNDPANAVKDYNLALYCQPYEEDVFAQIVYERGRSFSALQQWDDALRDYQDALDSEFSNDQLRANILGGRAMVYIMQEEFQLAANNLTAAIDCNPAKDLDQMLYLRGSVYAKLNRYVKALPDFTRAITMNGDDEDRKAALLLERGRIHRENQSPDLARQDFEAALSCTITKEGLREEIAAELNPKIAPTMSKSSSILGWVTSKLTRVQKK